MKATCSITDDGDNDLFIKGTEGTIICHEFWKAHQCTLKTGTEEETFSSDFNSEFSFETQHFINRINNGSTEEDERNKEISICVTSIMETRP